MKALVVPAAGQDSSGVLIDDEDLAIDDDIVAVLLEQLLRPNRVVEESDERGVHRVVQVVDSKLVLDLVNGRLEDANRLLLLVDFVIVIALEHVHDPGKLRIPAGRLVGRAADDEGRARLVDENRVDLVDHREVVAPLDELITRPRHVVAQVVEAELVVRAIGDVGGIGDATLRRSHVREDDANLEAEEPMDASHPLGVALGKVVVDRDDMDALAGQRIEIGRQGGNEGLALTRAHLSDVAHVEGCPTHDLDVIVTLAERSPRRLANGRERFRQEVIEGLPGLIAVLVLLGELPQLRVSEGGEVLLDGIDRFGDRMQSSQDLAFSGAEDLVEESHSGRPFGSGHSGSGHSGS
ncbi:unannotated protein [freshwater metagenome]|uniref:Unannotated protein n=1 Tax=freshwater metagenome TaxID=449393 RepID=A0A6J7LAK1_9ZZZZ